MCSKMRLGSRVLVAWTLLGLAGTATARAGAPFLVADVVTTPQGSEPAHFVAMGDKVFFAASHPLSGRELWVTDGTKDGTLLLKDINPGQDSGDPQGLVVLGGKLWFVATDPVYGSELWVSDGSEAGTTLALDLYPGTTGSELDELTVFADRLWFVANHEQLGRELWVSNGTAGGTQVLDLRVEGYSWPAQLTVSDDRLYFTAYTEQLGRELWSSDGSVEGTRLHFDIYLGPGSGLRSSDRLLAHNGLLYFESSGRFPNRLWRTDARPASTFALDLTPVGSPNRPQLVGMAGDRLVFEASYPDLEVWSTIDGSSFERLGDLRRTAASLTANDQLFFGGETAAHGFELWRTDGTSEGTRRVLDAVSEGSANPIAYENGKLWFQAYLDGALELWVEDGSLTGPTRLGDFSIGAAYQARLLQGRLWFAGESPEYGEELWSSDGTIEGTTLVRDINDIGTGPWHLGSLQSLGDRVLVFSGGELWISDGSAGGTFEVSGPEVERVDPFYEADAELGDRIYFKARAPEAETEIWWSDGEKIEPLTRIATDEATRFIDLESTGQRLVFVSGDRDVARLWGSDGKDVVQLVTVERDLSQGGGDAGDFAVADIVRSGDEAMVFLGWNYYGQGQIEEVWRTDGTVAGTHRVAEVNRPEYSTWLATDGPFVSFLQHGEQARRPFELWRTDGSTTTKVATLPEVLRATSGLHALRDRWLISGYNDDVEGREQLWSINASGETHLLLAGQEFEELAVVGGRIYVESRSGDGGHLWQLDADTLALQRLIGLSDFTRFKTWGEVLYYNDEDAVWRTDGTPEGTVRLGRPMASGDLVEAGGLLYFAADDGIHGRELWALEPECIPSREVLCLSGRIQARARWRDALGNAAEAHPELEGANTGTFSFFGSEYPEVVLNLLDGRAFNDHFWAYSGAATDLEVDLRLFDIETGRERRHFHPLGNLSSFADIYAFADSVDAASSEEPLPLAGSISIPTQTRQGQPSTCTPSTTTLCLGDGRFAVSVEWRDHVDATGVGRGELFTDIAGSFVFFSADQIEILIKVLDGRDINGHFWVYAGSLTDVEYRLTVTDTHTGTARDYLNPAGRIGGFADTEAFRN